MAPDSSTFTLARHLVVGGKHACANVDNMRCFYVLNPYVKQRATHHVQDGQPVVEF